jgi:hypothetical protein
MGYQSRVYAASFITCWRWGWGSGLRVQTPFLESSTWKGASQVNANLSKKKKKKNEDGGIRLSPPPSQARLGRLEAQSSPDDFHCHWLLQRGFSLSSLQSAALQFHKGALTLELNNRAFTFDSIKFFLLTIWIEGRRRWECSPTYFFA